MPSSPIVKIKQTVTVVGSEIPSPKVAGFSSRGPNTFIPGVIKVYKSDEKVLEVLRVANICPNKIN